MGRLSSHAWTVGALVVVLVILGVITYARVAPQGFLAPLRNDLAELQPNKSTPFTDLDGNPVTLTDFKGLPLIINSWATWMPFSASEIPLIERTVAQYDGRLAFLAINRMEDPSVIRSYLSYAGMASGPAFLLDSNDTFYRTIGGYAMPETVFYAADGTIFSHKRGVLTESELIETIEQLLSQD